MFSKIFPSSSVEKSDVKQYFSVKTLYNFIKILYLKISKLQQNCEQRKFSRFFNTTYYKIYSITIHVLESCKNLENKIFLFRLHVY